MPTSKEGSNAGARQAAALHHRARTVAPGDGFQELETDNKWGKVGWVGLTWQRDSQVGVTAGTASTARKMGSSPPGNRQASRKDSFLYPGAVLNLHWGTCLGFFHLLLQISMLILLLTPQSWDSQVANNQRGNGVLFCSESIFLHSVSTPGHECLMLTFSPYPGIWLFYEIAHSHLFNLKSIRQRRHSM